MTLLECIQAFVATNSGLAARLPGGVRPVVYPQALGAPAAVVRSISGVANKPTHDGGASPWHTVRIQIEVYDADATHGEQTGLILRTMLRSFNGYLGQDNTNGRFATSSFGGPRNTIDPTTKLFIYAFDLIGMLNMDTLS